jgi:hypothetical protein
MLNDDFLYSVGVDFLLLLMQQLLIYLDSKNGELRRHQTRRARIKIFLLTSIFVFLCSGVRTPDRNLSSALLSALRRARA